MSRREWERLWRACSALPRAKADPFSDVSAPVFRADIPIEPRVKQRPRVVYRACGGWDEGSRPAVVALTPKPTRLFEAELRAVCAAEMMRARMRPFAIPVVAGVRIVFAGDAARAAVSRRWGDLDNLEKAVLDALNGTVVEDDRLVVAKASQKAFGEVAGITVVVAPARAEAVSGDTFDRIIGPLLGEIGRVRV